MVRCGLLSPRCAIYRSSHNGSLTTHTHTTTKSVCEDGDEDDDGEAWMWKKRSMKQNMYFGGISIIDFYIIYILLMFVCLYTWASLIWEETCDDASG